MNKQIKIIAEKYLHEIKQDFEFSKLLIQKTGHDNKDLVDFVNDSAIISICIKYESFTSEAMYAIRRKDVAYNKPWAYTRYFMRVFKMDLEYEYQRAHDAWEYYNSLKHENHKSIVEKTKFVSTHKIHNSWDALQFVHSSITAILIKFANQTNS